MLFFLDADFCFGCAKILDEWNMARTYICTRAAFDTAMQMMRSGLCQCLLAYVPIEHLRLQQHRTCGRAKAAAHAGEFRQRSREFVCCGCEHTIGSSQYRHFSICDFCA